MAIIRIISALLFPAVSLSSAIAAQAPDAWPARPIRVVVPFVAGGGVDVVARITTTRLGGALGQQVIVDNRPGARAVIGTEIVSKAAPDGYTLLVVSDALTIMPFVERKLAFDVRRSFAPVSLLATQPLVLAVHPSVPAQSVKRAAGVRDRPVYVRAEDEPVVHGDRLVPGDAHAVADFGALVGIGSGAHARVSSYSGFRCIERQKGPAR